MQKLFDLKLRAKASENSPANLDQMTRLNTNPSEIVASVAASVAAGTTGPSSYVTKPSLLDIPSSGEFIFVCFSLVPLHLFYLLSLYTCLLLSSALDDTQSLRFLRVLDHLQGNQWHLSHWLRVKQELERSASSKARRRELYALVPCYLVCYWQTLYASLVVYLVHYFRC